MTEIVVPDFPAVHSQIFLGEGHEHAERRTWAVIALCGSMMIFCIVGGWLFGSIALVADGLHMSTHAGAMSPAAIAYSYARRHAEDPRFTFGTGKLGDLSGFTSAIVLAMIAILIGDQAVTRYPAPIPIQVRGGHPDRVPGLARKHRIRLDFGGGDHHHHTHGHHHHGHAHGHGAPEEEHHIRTSDGVLALSVFEDNHPPVFRLQVERGPAPKDLGRLHRDRPAGGVPPIFVMADGVGSRKRKRNP